MATSTQTPDETVIDRAGPDTTDWRLLRREGTLLMRKTIPYDGVRVYSTESREYVSHRKSSRFGLSEAQVVALYQRETGRDVEVEA